MTDTTPTPTDVELSLKIAEHLGMVEGPYPVEGKWRNVEDGTMTEVTIPSFVTDPAMRDLLQAELLEDGCRIEIWRESDNQWFMKLRWVPNRADFIVEAITREHIWPEAAARAWGLL